VAGSSACQSDAERVQGESFFHLEKLVKILESTANNTDAAIAEMDKYLVENRERILDVKASGIRMMERMSPAERDRFIARSAERVRPVKDRIEILVRTFPDPPRLLQKVQEFY
jgi:hypothetical protein